MAKFFYLMRHGQTLFNQQGRIQGACDSPLTDLGIAQAKAAYHYFKNQGISFTHIYSSTQERACDTAEIATGCTDYVRLKGLKEMDFGAFEGHQEYLNPHLYREDGTGYRDYFVAYGGESSSQVHERMGKTIREVMESRSDKDTILFVSHAAAITQFYRFQTIHPPTLEKGLSNCGILKIGYDDGIMEVGSIYNPIDEEYLFTRNHSH